MASSKTRGTHGSMDMDGSSTAAVKPVLQQLAAACAEDFVQMTSVDEATPGVSAPVNGNLNPHGSEEHLGLTDPNPSVSFSGDRSRSEGSGTGERAEWNREHENSSGGVSPIPIESSPAISRSHSRHHSSHSQAPLLAGDNTSSVSAGHFRGLSRSFRPTAGMNPSYKHASTLTPPQHPRHARKKSSWSSGEGISLAFGAGVGAREGLSTDERESAGGGNECSFVLLSPSSSAVHEGDHYSKTLSTHEGDIDVQMIDLPLTRAPANSLAVLRPEGPQTPSPLGSPFSGNGKGGNLKSMFGKDTAVLIASRLQEQKLEQSQTLAPPPLQPTSKPTWKFWKKDSITSPPPLPPVPRTNSSDDVFMDTTTTSGEPDTVQASAAAAATRPLASSNTKHQAATMPTPPTSSSSFLPLFGHWRKSNTMPASTLGSASSTPSSLSSPTEHEAISPPTGPASPVTPSSVIIADSPSPSSVILHLPISSSTGSVGETLKATQRVITPKNKSPRVSAGVSTIIEEGRTGGHKRQKSNRGDDVHSSRLPTAAETFSVGGSSVTAIKDKVTAAFGYLSPPPTWRSFATAAAPTATIEQRRRSSAAESGSPSPSVPLRRLSVASIPTTLPLTPPIKRGSGISTSSVPSDPEENSVRPDSPSAELNCYDDSVFELQNLRSPRPTRSVPVFSSWTRTTTFPHVLPTSPRLLRVQEKPASYLVNVVSGSALPLAPTTLATQRPTMSSKAASLLGLAPPSSVSANGLVGGSTATTAPNSATSSAANSQRNSPKMPTRPLPIPFPGQRSASMIVVGSNGNTSRVTSPQMNSVSPPAGTLSPPGASLLAAITGPFSELRSIISGHSPGYYVFLRHLQREYASESLLFWKAMEDFLPLAARDAEAEAKAEAAKLAADMAATIVNEDTIPPPPPPESTRPAGADSCGFSLLYLSIFNMYIRAGSKCEINISSGLRDKLKMVAQAHEDRLAAARGEKSAAVVTKSKQTLCLSHITPIQDDPSEDVHVTLVVNPLLALPISGSITSASSVDSSAGAPQEARSSQYLVQSPLGKASSSMLGQRSKSLFCKLLSAEAPREQPQMSNIAASTLGEPHSPPSVVHTQDDNGGLPLSSSHQPSHSVSDLVLAEMSIGEEVAPEMLQSTSLPSATLSSPRNFSVGMMPLSTSATSVASHLPISNSNLSWQTYQHLHASLREIENLLVQDCLPRFKHSPMWAKYVAATGIATTTLASMGRTSEPSSSATSPLPSAAATPVQSPRGSFALPTPSSLPSFSLPPTPLTKLSEGPWGALRRTAGTNGTMHTQPAATRHSTVAPDTFFPADMRARANTTHTSPCK